MKTLFTIALLTVALFLSGCTVGVDTYGSPAYAPAVTVGVDAYPYYGYGYPYGRGYSYVNGRRYYRNGYRYHNHPRPY